MGPGGLLRSPRFLLGMLVELCGIGTIVLSVFSKALSGADRLPWTFWLGLTLLALGAVVEASAVAAVRRQHRYRRMG